MQILSSQFACLPAAFGLLPMHPLRGLRTCNGIHGICMHSLATPGTQHPGEHCRCVWAWLAGMLSGTTAAILGGVTTVIDMPLNSNPVTTTVEQLRAKQAVAKVSSSSSISCSSGGVRALTVSMCAP